VTVTPLPDGTTGGIDGTDDYTLIVKFADAAQARVAKNQLSSLSGWDLSDAESLAASEQAVFQQIFTAGTCPGLNTLQDIAAERSGRQQPDAEGIHRLAFSQAKTAQQMADLGNNLLALAEVEYALLRQILPGPPPTPTPDFTAGQTYRGPDPGGDFEFAHSIGLTGFGIRVSEVSITWDDVHEDINTTVVENEQGQQIIEFGIASFWDLWKDHGTATLGMILSIQNLFGTTGMAYGAEGHFYPTVVKDPFSPVITERLLAAYCNALAESALTGMGHVVYLEHQTNALWPMETDMDVFDLTRMGTDAGVVVLAVGGNGDLNLDGPNFATWRSWGDSGAIIVGAGSSDTAHNRLLFEDQIQPGSNYGSRVNVQGWGQNVVTTGWNGDLAQVDGDIHRKYTFSFGGTSSATPMVSAAALLAQQQTVAQGLTPLDSRDMRSLLTHTGIQQGTGEQGNIGPFINVRAAIEQFDQANLGIQTASTVNGITTTVSNDGPRIARGVSATITYDSDSASTLMPVDVPESCQFEPPTGSCPGSCPSVLQCSFAEITVETPIEIIFESGCQQIHFNIDVNAEVQMSGELIDPDVADNIHNTTLSSGCLQ